MLEALPSFTTDFEGAVVNVRIIQEADWEKIIELSKEIFLVTKNDRTISLDYVAQYFLRWKYSSNRLMVGIEYNGELIGFRCVTLLNNGKTLWREGLRIAIQYQGKGLNKIFEKGTKFILQNHNFVPTSIENISLCRTHSAEESKIYLEKNPAAKLIDTRYIYVLQNSVEFRSKLQSLFESRFTLKPAFPLSAESFFEIATENKDLLPMGTITSDWTAFEITLKNLIILESGGQGLWENRFHSLKDPGHGKLGVDSICIASVSPRCCGVVKCVQPYTNCPEDALNYLYYHAFNEPNYFPTFSNETPASFWFFVNLDLAEAPEMLQFQNEFSEFIEFSFPVLLYKKKLDSRDDVQNKF